MLVIQHLQNVPQFKNLSSEHLIALATFVKSENYFASQFIVRQGDAGDRLFIIAEGEVNLRQTDASGFERNLRVLPAPNPANPAAPLNYFGEQMFTTQEPFPFAVVALINCTLLTLEHGDLMAFVLANADAAKEMPFLQEAERKRTRGFDWVNKGESVALVVRRHWWTLVPDSLKVVVAALVAGLLTWALFFFHLEAFWFVPVLVWVGVALAAAWIAYDWWNDEYIITTHRVARIERVFLTAELRESIPIEKLQNVRIDKSGISAWLNIGKVTIQSGGKDAGDVTFDWVSQPEQIRKTIALQQSRVQARTAAEKREQRRREIERDLRGYILPQTTIQNPPASPKAAAQHTMRHRLRQWVGTLLNEEIHRGSTIIWRKHWLVLLQQTGRWLLGLVAFDAILIAYAIVPGVQVLPAGAHLLGGLVALLILLGGVWWEWEDWRNDTYAITDTQVIDAERLPLGLDEKSTTAPLDQVQDVRVEVPGLAGLVLDVGNVTIETASAGGQMKFKSVRHPRLIADLVFKRLQDFRARKLEGETSMRNRDMIDAFVTYHRLLKEEEHLLRQRQQPPAQPPPPNAADPGAPPPPDAKPPADKSQTP